MSPRIWFRCLQCLKTIKRGNNKKAQTQVFFHFNLIPLHVEQSSKNSRRNRLLHFLYAMWKFKISHFLCNARPQKYKTQMLSFSQSKLRENQAISVIKCCYSVVSCNLLDCIMVMLCYLFFNILPFQPCLLRKSEKNQVKKLQDHSNKLSLIS